MTAYDACEVSCGSDGPARSCLPAESPAPPAPDPGSASNPPEPEGEFVTASGAGPGPQPEPEPSDDAGETETPAEDAPSADGILNSFSKLELMLGTFILVVVVVWCNARLKDLCTRKQPVAPGGGGAGALPAVIAGGGGEVPAAIALLPPAMVTCEQTDNPLEGVLGGSYSGFRPDLEQHQQPESELEFAAEVNSTPAWAKDEALGFLPKKGRGGAHD